MSDKENKLERLKQRLVKIQEKIQDRMEDIQDQVQTKIEQSNKSLTRFVSHLSEDKSSLDDQDSVSTGSDQDKNLLIGADVVFKKCDVYNKIPAVTVDESEPPNDIVHEDPKIVCKDFITIEKHGVLYKRKSLSALNLALDDGSDYLSSSDTCFSSDERYYSNFIDCLTEIELLLQFYCSPGNVPAHPTLCGKFRPVKSSLILFFFRYIILFFCG